MGILILNTLTFDFRSSGVLFANQYLAWLLFFKFSLLETIYLSRVRWNFINV